MATGVKQQQRRGTAAEWNTSDHVLSAGELGVTTDTGIIKIGDGVNGWNDLPVAFASDYLPIVGKAADSELLDGINSTGFWKTSDATTAATADKLALRSAAGRLKAVAGASSDDVVNYTQLIDAQKEIVSRTVSADITLAASDVGRLIIMNNASYTPGLVCTIPTNAAVAIPDGSYIDIATADKGPVVLTPSGGVTIFGQTIIHGGGSTSRLIKTSTNAWHVLLVSESPGPILRRKIKTGSDNSLTSSMAALRLDGANSGTALFSNNADTLGTGEQWSSADNYKCFCRRAGWYDVVVQFSVPESRSDRIFASVSVNDIDQNIGTGTNRIGSPDSTVRVGAKIPMNVGDYVKALGQAYGTSPNTISDNPWGHSVVEWSWLRPL